MDPIKTNQNKFDINSEFIIFDVETTGLSPIDGDKIIEIAGLKVQNLKVTGKFHSLIDPERDIPFGASSVNGITNDMVIGASKARDVLPRFRSFAGSSAMVGHNIRFDMDFLCHGLAMIGERIEPVVVVDTMRLAREFIPQLGRYPLWRVAAHFAIKDGQTHRAMADVELTFEVFKKLTPLIGSRNILQIGSLEYDFAAFRELSLKMQQGTFQW